MAVESATTIAELNPAWPLGIDLKSEGDNHIRLIKQVLQAEFPTGAAGVVKPTAQARNRIANPAMQISQENGNTVGTAAVGYYAADQWPDYTIYGGAHSFQRVQVATPNGSVNRLRLTITTADAAVAAGDLVQIFTRIEGIRIADFRWGTAAAKQAILRFGFKAPAGSYGVAIQQPSGTHSWATNITIAAGQANTDTVQTFVIPGPTIGTWAVDTSVGLDVVICPMVGSTSVAPSANTWVAGNYKAAPGNTNGAATVGNTFEVFDVGLYLDPDATGIAPKWVMPDEAQELAACQRYFYKLPGIWVMPSTTVQNWYFKVSMRANVAVTGGGAGFAVAAGGAEFAQGYQTTAATQTLLFNARM